MNAQIIKQEGGFTSYSVNVNGINYIVRAFTGEGKPLFGTGRSVQRNENKSSYLKEGSAMFEKVWKACGL